MPIRKVAIIGAGLAGLALALFLKDIQVECTIYELRKPDVTSEGAVTLSPNALRTLDTLGVLSRIKSRGWFFQYVHFHGNDYQLIDKYEMGSTERYGYDAFRIYRQVLLDEMRLMVSEAGIKIHYEKRFSHVVSENAQSMTFAFTDGQQETVDLLVGADGIHSSVRKYLHPAISPAFSGWMGLTAAAPVAKMNFPSEDYALPSSVSGSAGPFFIAPQDAGATEALVGTQTRTHDRTREEWEALDCDKAQLLALLRANYETWNPLVQSAIDAIPQETLSIWAVHTMPTLDRWASPDFGRVLILGDAAHAVSPAAGQGVNQAFEDVHSLARLVAVTNKGHKQWLAALQWWNVYRQGRMDRVHELTAQMNQRREAGLNAARDLPPMDGSNVFAVDIDRDVDAWVSAAP